MTWDNILALVAGIIVSFGGAGAIIVAISKWLGNMIADGLQKKLQVKYDKELEAIKQAHQKEIEAYKSELQIICEHEKRKNTEAIYVTEKQFDIEIHLIEELTEKAFELEMTGKSLYPQFGYKPLNTELEEKLKQERYSKVVDANNAFIKILGKSRAFISEEIYLKYVSFNNLCQLQTHWYMEDVFNHALFDNKMLSDCYNRSIEIEKLNAEINLMIKDYLKKLIIE